jgi:acetyl-CoA C-acetyltransferase
MDPRTPVLVGAGQVVQRAEGLDDALEPVDLMAEAVRAAATDAGLTAIPAPDSIRVVNSLSWRYRDPARLLAEILGVDTRETAYTTASGNTPQLLVNATAGDLAAGRLDLALIVGGECWRTRMRARRNDAFLNWKKLPDDTKPDRTFGDDVPMNHQGELDRGLVMPVQLYPMFETAVRAAAGEGVDEHQVKVSELWSRFAAVAAGNPFAWVRRALTPEEIRTPGPDNRMIGFPYPKYMNSNNDVDMASALLLCTVERAEALDIPRDRWVFPHAGTNCHDHYFVSERETIGASPAVRIGGRTVLELAGVGIDDVEVIDLYSCFPSAVQVGAAELGLDLERQLTRTGGLSFAGGPWNNYVGHAIATVVQDLRNLPGATALVWGNGGYLTKHSFGVYSTEPPANGFRAHDPQAEIDALPRRELAEPADADGPATVEAYTVMHSREGTPEIALAACLLGDGRRVWGTSNDEGIAAAMCEGEWVGRHVTLDAEGVLSA